MDKPTYEQVTDRLNQMGREGVLKHTGASLRSDPELITTPRGAAFSCKHHGSSRLGRFYLYYVTDHEGQERIYHDAMREEALRAFYALCEQEGLCKNA